MPSRPKPPPEPASRTTSIGLCCGAEDPLVQRCKTERGAAGIGWAASMVYWPSEGPAQPIVLGSTRLDSYYLDTGEQRWWMPIGSGGALGTPVATNGTLLVSTLSSTEPWMPNFESVLTMYDKDHDGRLSHEEFKVDKDLGEHFGWIDGHSVLWRFKNRGAPADVRLGVLLETLGRILAQCEGGDRVLHRASRHTRIDRKSVV